MPEHYAFRDAGVPRNTHTDDHTHSGSVFYCSARQAKMPSPLPTKSKICEKLPKFNVFINTQKKTKKSKNS